MLFEKLGHIISLNMRGIILAIAILCSLANPLTVFAASAVETSPSTAPLLNGPFIISAYSFAGHSLRYVQITNVSRTVAQLDGWTVKLTLGGSSWVSPELSGKVAPGKKVTVADTLVMPSATFSYDSASIAADPVPESIILAAPVGAGLSDHLVDISVKPTTVRDSLTQPATFYFQRNISSSTGEYLSTFTATTKPASIESDQLYSPLDTSPLQVVEIYPKARSCSPADIEAICYDYVKLYNASTGGVSLSDFAVKAGSLSGANAVYPKGILAKNEYVIVRMSLRDTSSYVWIEDVYGLIAYKESVVQYPSASGREGLAWSYNDLTGEWQWTTGTPSNQANWFAPKVETNRCLGLRFSEIGANLETQFIEVYNSTGATLDISGCRLMTNRSSTVSYVFPTSTTMVAGGYRAVPVSETSLALTKTTSGTVYLLSSDGETEVDSKFYENLSSNTSLALVGGVWQQTFKVTPGFENIYEKYLPCQTGYTRNEITGNCNKIALTTAVLEPCLDGYYRNPETNRCKKVETTIATLMACPLGYERNPETNRCKKIASTQDELKACDEGYERNPETNRCRKVLSATSSVSGAPAASSANEGKNEDGLGAWTWVIVVVGGAGAIAYGVYEWRHEIGGLAKRIASRFSKSK